MLGMINQDEDIKISVKCSVAHQLLLKFTKSWIVFEQHCPQYDLNMLIFLSITKWFLWSLGMTLMDFANSSSDSFFALADLNTFYFPSQGSLYCPQVVNFSRSVEKCWCHSCQGFCKFNRCSSSFFFWQIFLVLESNLIFQRSCLFKS